jgi:predicted nucleic acid-binding Zn ribbon protein
MRKANDKTMKEAIAQMLNVYKIKRKYDESSIVANWAEIVGKPVANRTSEIFISNKKMFLRIESSVVKNELLMMRAQIIEKINTQAGDTLVEEVIFL